MRSRGTGKRARRGMGRGRGRGCTERECVYVDCGFMWMNG